MAQIKKLSPTIDGIKELFKEPIYPLLFAISPILYFYRQNIDELTLGALPMPLLVSLVVTTLLLLGLNRVVRNWHKTAALIGVALVVVYLYQPVVNMVPPSLFSFGAINISRGKVMMPLAGLLFLGTLVIGWRFTLAWLEHMTKPLNILMVVLLAFSAFGILRVEITRALNPPVKDVGLEVPKGTVSKLGYRPDVYYIIFDRYAGEQTLLDDYDFSNAEFLDDLEAEGFYIAHRSHTNYPSTPFSIASSLNMEYHTSYAGHGAYPSVATTILPKISNPKVGQLFRSMGYKFYHFSTASTWLVKSDIADGIYAYGEDITGTRHNDFAAMIYQGTIMPSILNNIVPDFSETQYEHFVASHVWQIDNLTRVVNLDGPKFIYSHILLPHNPYVLDSQCKPLASSEFSNKDSIPRYLKQLKCANRFAMTYIDAIQQSSPRNAIIIVQADEGPHAMAHKPAGDVETWQVNPEVINDLALQERTRILNAYYFPDQDYSQLYNAITPVNSFRTVFRQYFNLDFDNLADKVYGFQGENNLFDFIDITDRVAQRPK